jgi:hypothetical protein
LLALVGLLGWRRRVGDESESDEEPEEEEPDDDEDEEEDDPEEEDPDDEDPDELDEPEEALDALEGSGFRVATRNKKGRKK